MDAMVNNGKMVAQLSANDVNVMPAVNIVLILGRCTIVMGQVLHRIAMEPEHHRSVMGQELRTIEKVLLPIDGTGPLECLA